jgi:hypothetical protein
MPNPVVDRFGNRRWFIEGTQTLHREGGPAFEGTGVIRQQWFERGIIHRMDGPATVYTDGSGDYWMAGIHYEEKEYKYLTKYVNRLFKDKFLSCRGCGKKSIWIVGTHKRSFVCTTCRSL